MVLSVALMLLLGNVNATCDAGSYEYYSRCEPCSAGYYCTGGSSGQTGCSSGYYCPQSSSSQIYCPAGFYCSSTSSFPQICDISAGYYSTGGATSCSYASGQYYLASASSRQSCTAAPLASMICPDCPAGSSCSGGSSSAGCTGSGYNNYFANTFGSCDTTDSGYFAPNGYFAQIDCPDERYSSTGASSCSYVSAGYYSNGQTTQSQCSTSNQQSGYGVGTCTYAPVGYYVGSGSGGSGIAMPPISTGYYKSSQSDSDPTSCGQNEYCTTTTTTGCDAMKYSEDGQSYCTRVRIGYYITGGYYSACSQTGYNTVTSSCVTCSYMKCDQYTAITQICPVGYYLSSSSTFTCSICEAGYSCSDGVNRVQTSAQYSIKQGTGFPDAKGQCPAGYTCTYYSMAQSSNGFFSVYGQTDSTDVQYMYQRDLGGQDCPEDTYETSERLRCQPSSFGYTRDSTHVTEAECSGTGEMAWIGEACESIPNSNTNYMFNDDEQHIEQGVHCPTGWGAFLTDGSPSNYYCGSQLTATSVNAAEYVKGTSYYCETGDVTMSSFSTGNSVTHFTDLSYQNENANCQDCPPNMACMTGGATVYPYAEVTDTSAFSQYCVGKDPNINWYDANNGNLLVQMDDRRVSQYGNTYCMDCNHEDYAAGSCAFAADYFPDHVRTDDADNTFFSDMIVKCPFQSNQRTQTRYLDSTAQWTRLDESQWQNHDLEATDYTYQTYAYFDDTEDNIYAYSYCDRDETYFTSEQITSHSEFPDSTEVVNTECTLYEYFTPNFPMCEPNYGGFISPTNHNQPTETAVPDGYLTSMFQNDDYTGIKLVQCPEFTSPIMVEGGTNPMYACHISNLGVCKDSTSDYCNNGQDYMCPDGWNKRTSGTFNNDINDCESCGAGQVCSATTESTVCPDGYNCEAMTDDVYSKPGQPGELLTINGDGQYNDISTCTGGYCEGATYTTTLLTCPDGYYNSYSGDSADGQHSLAGCTPTASGTYSSSSTTCGSGKMCPPGTATELEQPAGYYSASTGRGSLNDLDVCAAGDWCAGNGATTVDCSVGFYCAAGTVFQYDTPCSFGQTSTAGNSALSSCSSCTDGDFCQQGSTSPASGSYCGDDNFLCIGGDLERTECSTGQYTTDGASCSNCPAGQFCTSGIPATDCSAGYESAGSLSTCDLSTAGQVTTGGSSTADATDGQWTITGQTTEFDCPAGSWCASGVITECQASETCAQGSSSASTASAGTVGDETGLWYDKPCPSGYTCDASSTRAQATVGTYAVQGTDSSSPTYCNDGYSCAAGSIGPYQEACADGTYYLTGVDSATCPACADGSYCYQAQQITCEEGFYCDLSSSPEWHQQCPLGTFASTTGTNSVLCTECSPGYACNQPGITEDPTSGNGNSYPCSQGYFCITAATSTQPERIVGVTTSPYDDTYQCNPYNYDSGQTGTITSLTMSNSLVCNQGVCPKGYYCPEGTSWPVVCPAGTYNLNVGEVDTDGCVSCIDGYYCPTTQERVACDAGTVCPTGQDNQDSVTNLSKPATGQYSLTKYPEEIPCYFGTYQTSTGSSSCDTCDAGSQCDVTGLSAVVTCDRGSDCSSAGTIVPKNCYYGQYLDPSNSVNPNCVDCPEDNYCWTDAIIEADVTADNIMGTNYKVAGLCPSGYKCVSGANIFGPNHLYADNSNHYLCREGYYCDNSESGVEIQCAVGTYMPRVGAESSSDCLSCKPGYECENLGTSVPTDCPSGMYCAEGTGATLDQCTAGYYCPDNAEQEFQCAYGTYAAGAGETSCTDAAAGNYIDAVQQSSETECTAGYYCELGQVTPIPCPSGTTSSAGAEELADCTDKPIGEYVLGPTVTGTIDDGYYSDTAGEYFNIPIRFGDVCPPGSFCTGGVRADCVAGTRCEYEMTSTNEVASQDECDAGYYCEAGTSRRRPTDVTLYNGAQCTAGNYCEISSTAPTACEVGYYSDAIGLQALSECAKCKNGKYCPTEALAKADMLDCPAGKYCTYSTSTTASAPDCDYGKYCPLGSMEEIPCEPGYYSDAQGESECTVCEETYYCPFEYTLVQVGVSQKYNCPLGYVCQDTGMSAATPCIAGYYTNSENQITCATCEEGYYCPLMATGDYTAYPCPDHFYCEAGTAEPVLCGDGYECMSAYNDAGSSFYTQNSLTVCSAGYFCIQGERYPCLDGYMCLSGSSTPTPTDGALGKLCDQGYYCAAVDSTQGPTTQVACGVGNYQPYYGATTVDNCLECPSGTACTDDANIQYTVVSCTAGYICGSGADVPCDQGMYCPAGTLVMLVCPDGYYQDQTAQTSCTLCLEGYYCSVPVGDTVGIINPVKCPDGHYCPQGTSNYQVFRCPTGTYHDTTTTAALIGLTDSSGCSDCPETYYCPQVAMIDSAYTSFECQDGYLCNAGSASSTGSSECPRDNYCEAGTQIPCPDGYYSTATGLRGESECLACQPGKVCPSGSTGITSCLEGYYCPGALYDDNQATICPRGAYCPTGSSLPTLCEPGEYQDAEGQTSCLTCTQGNYCPTSGLEAATTCATDFQYWYCPAGSIYPTKCDIGYYIESNNYQCTPCGAGKYCWPSANNEHDGNVGDCDYASGYLCREGAFSPKPLIDGLAFIQSGSNLFNTYNGPVLGGYTAGDLGVATACVVGTWQPSILSLVCIDCYDGRYCPNEGMGDIDEYICAAGFYCLKGNWLEEPPTDTIYVSELTASLSGTIIGGECHVERECKYTMIHEMECEDGFISQETGLSQCSSCPTDYYCDMAEDMTDPVECITQSVCNGNEKRQPICPAGTFMNEGDEYCQKCIAGSYCRAGIIAEECAAGFLCSEAEFHSQPDPAGYECEAGDYCPKGNTVAVPCPFESQSIITEARMATDCVACQPGYLCEYGERNATECPIGYYCPPKADDKVYKGEQYPCALGTYNPWTKQIYQHDCLDCDAGYYCNETATANVTGLDCPAGHYCPLRTIQPRACPAGTYQGSVGAIEEDACEGCPLGKYCPEGAAEPWDCEAGYYCPYRSAQMVTCEGGFYCNEDTRYQQFQCPANYYCPQGSALPIECTKDVTCPAGSEYPDFCRNGYYVDTRPSSYGGVNICRKCKAGTYSIYDPSGLSVGCRPCPAGYLCYGGTSSNTPNNITIYKGELCPKGQYCPESSYVPVDCKPGTYNKFFGGKGVEDCAKCKIGTAQALWAQEGCNPCGQFASSDEGAEQCTCIGANRVYSPVDNSCRCRTGFDFKNTDNISEGESSDTTDCIPLVLDRCDGPNEVRGPTGDCKQLDDCGDECNGGSGTRDQVLGVCTCSTSVSTDELCNQECRADAPVQGFATPSKMTLTNKDGTVSEINLNSYGDVFGAPDGTGNTRTVSMSGSGFAGSYDPPAVLQDAQDAKDEELGLQPTTTRRRRLNLEPTAEQIPNPVYCLQSGDNFMFTIDSPENYPQYMRNSVMNSNKDFDFGAFKDLETEMKRKEGQGLTTGSIFTFTFNTPGNYVFQDAKNPGLIMVISVKGQGESCADPDRYLQIMSGDALASFGVSQRTDIIVQPNYPLLVSMLFITIGGTAITLYLVHYCMHKGWFIKDMNDSTYRDSQMAINIHHENERVFVDRNDFVQHKSELIDHEEEDLDNANLDIQQDLVDAGKVYLHKYNKRQHKHKKQQNQKRRKLRELLDEIEGLVSVLNSDQAAMQIHWLDLETEGDNGSMLDDKAIKRQIEKQMDQLHKQEEAQNETYKAKKSELLEQASDRERNIHSIFQKKLQETEDQIAKENNRSDEVVELNKTATEFAIYHNGDVKTKDNQLVAKIQKNEALDDGEKERMLQQHEGRMHGIDNVLEAEKRKQEQELDRALKERLDRRHRMREKQHGKDIRREEAEVEKTTTELLEKKQAESKENLAKEHDQQVKEILENTDLTLQRQQLQDLEELHAQKQKQTLLDLEEQNLLEIAAKKQEIQNKYMSGQNEEDLQAELKKLMQDAQQSDSIIGLADQEKAQQEARLKERLAKRQKQQEAAIKEEAKTAAKQIEKEDVIAHYEQEVVSTEAHLRLKQKAKVEDGNDGTLPKGCVGLDKEGMPITDLKLVKAADVARKEEEERKEAMNEARFRLDQEIDTSLQQKSLLQDLEQSDANLALILKQQQDAQEAKLQARRAQLKARRLAKAKDEQEDKIVAAKVETKEEEQKEKRKITEDYVRKLFKSAKKNETQEQQNKRLEILNEFLSDQFLDELSTLLTKQYMETDAMLKKTMHKYMDENIQETTSIKTHFKIDQDSLEKIKPHMSEEKFNATMKKLKLNEQNLLRQTDLIIQRLHAEEEARIRKELDKKHMTEQVEMRQFMSIAQAQLRMQLIGESQLGNAEFELEKRALERFEQLKHTEQERRIRAIDLKKKNIANEVDSEMKAQYTDYEDMMRRKRDNTLELANQELAINKRIVERQDKLRKNNKMDSMTAEEQEQMLKNYEAQLSQLDSAYVSEQRRQQLQMKQKMDMRQKRLVKVQQLKTELEKKEAPQTSKVTNAFALALRNKLFKMDGEMHTDDNSELLKRLRDWNEHKHDYQLELFHKKAAQAGMAQLDENQIKIMIIKLQQIEKLLKELGKQKKMKARMGVTNTQRRGSRRMSVNSRGGLDNTLRGMLRPGSKAQFGTIEEDAEGHESDQELLSKNSTAKQNQLMAMTGSKIQKAMRGSGASKQARQSANDFLQRQKTFN